MKLTPLLALPALLFSSCVALQNAPLPPHETPTRIVNDHFAADKVRSYETYKLGSSDDYLIPGYAVVFVHMKNGAAYPVPCMPTSESFTPTLGVTVKANPKNDAWIVHTYLPRKDQRVYELAQCDFARINGDLYIGTRKLKKIPNRPLKD